VAALAICGHDVGDVGLYPQMPSSGAMWDGLARYADQIGEAAPGDIVVMLWKGEPRHMGVLVADGVVVHARGTAGRVVEEPIRRGHRVASAWRVRVVA